MTDQPVVNENSTKNLAAKSKTAIITGTNGFIGNVLLSTFRQSGYDVWGIDVVPLSHEQMQKADLLDLEQTRIAFRSIPTPDVIIHAAGLTTDKSPIPGRSVVDINTSMTRNLLEVITSKDIHFIFMSSVSVYGEAGRSEAVNSSSELHPATAYGESKVLCEELVKHSGFRQVSILRLAPVFNESRLEAPARRVLLPGPLKVKLKLRPSPRHSLCHLNTVTDRVLGIITDECPGVSVSNISDSNTYLQTELADWFSGPFITIPTACTKPLYWLLRLMPGRRGYALRCLYWKFFESNVYV